MKRSLHQLLQTKFSRGAALGVAALTTAIRLVVPQSASAETQVFPTPTPNTPHSSVIPVFMPNKEASATSIPSLGPVFAPPSRPSLSTLGIGEAIPLDDQLMLEAKVPEYEKEAQKLIQNPDVVALFQELNGMSEEDVTRSLRLYYPIYRLAQERWSIDWEYLAITHAAETNFSMNPEPGSSGYVGAMQRDRVFYADEQVATASRGLEFLNDFPQRYRSDLATDNSTDWQEILWSAWFIKRQSKIYYPDLDSKLAVRNVILYNYAAPEFGQIRVGLYDRLKEIKARDKLS